MSTSFVGCNSQSLDLAKIDFAKPAETYLKNIKVKNKETEKGHKVLDESNGNFLLSTVCNEVSCHYSFDTPEENKQITFDGIKVAPGYSGTIVEFAEKIRKSLALFNQIKSMTESIAKSPLAEGKFMFEIKSPVIAVSAQWNLDKALLDSCEVATIVEIGVDAAPLVAASLQIDIISIFIEYGGDAVCPGAGKLINWVLKKLKNNAGIKFTIEFYGGINVNGKTKINTLYPKETTGEIKATGEIKVTLEFKAWAKAEISYVAIDGLVKANVKTSVIGGIKFGADKKGIYSSPIAEFGGIIATFVAAGTIKFGLFKQTLTYESPPWVLVEKNEILFKKYYLDL